MKPRWASCLAATPRHLSSLLTNEKATRALKMKQDLPALLAYLRDGFPDKPYYGKILELREAVKGWLAYIPQTFPHYTRHTVEHSDRIIEQLSKLLFHDDDVERPFIALSGIEAYVLCAAALLHDSGMVASDTEKRSILESPEWREWTSTGSGAERFAATNALRNAAKPADSSVRNFLADVQLRFLLAEFIRVRHHERSGRFLSQHQPVLGRFAWDDPLLARTIADVCIGHGLDQRSLDDSDAYPLVRDVHREKVNVRLMAILFRLGDLLDIESDRACPLLLNAASPIPSLSRAHWTQYQRIRHRVTTPEAISIVAECVTQDEHRILTDWCNWIQAETEGAVRLLQASRYHSAWRPPRAVVGDQGTIQIRPAPSATYVPTTWRLEFDEDQILSRLIDDTYSDRLAFVRELLQNSIDATRCRLFVDLEERNCIMPAWPMELSTQELERFPIRLSLREEQVASDLSGEAETVQVLSVDDCGIGMSRDIIEKYFLQVGRSFYASADFTRRFQFPPIGRYGIGFLSVFGVSDHVVVETQSCLTTNGVDASGLRLTLTGPRNYLLLEKASRNRPGTSVTLRLKEPIEPGMLASAVDAWCRRVEFPIELDLPVGKSTVRAEHAGQFTDSAMLPSDVAAQFEVTAFPFATSHLRGELYVFSHTKGDRSSWVDAEWARNTYRKLHPLAKVPMLPRTVLCENGIDYSVLYETPWSHIDRRGLISIRADYRGPRLDRMLDRASTRRHSRSSLEAILRLDPAVETFVAQRVAEHIATRASTAGDREWVYKQRLIDTFPLESFWQQQPETTRVFSAGRATLKSLAEIAMLPAIELVQSTASIRYWHDWEKARVAMERPQSTVAQQRGHVAAILGTDMEFLASMTRQVVFGSRYPVRAEMCGESVIALQFASRSGSPQQRHAGKTFYRLPIDGYSRVGIAMRGLFAEFDAFVVLNTNHPLIAWLGTAERMAESGIAGLDRTAFATLMDLIVDATGHGLADKVAAANRYLESWRRLPNISEEEKPPSVVREAFMQYS